MSADDANQQEEDEVDYEEEEDEAHVGTDLGVHRSDARRVYPSKPGMSQLEYIYVSNQGPPEGPHKHKVRYSQIWLCTVTARIVSSAERRDGYLTTRYSNSRACL